MEAEKVEVAIPNAEIVISTNELQRLIGLQREQTIKECAELALKYAVEHDTGDSAKHWSKKWCNAALDVRDEILDLLPEAAKLPRVNRAAPLRRPFSRGR